MSAREAYLVERIDRAREAPAAKAARTRRAMFLRMQARNSISSMLDDLEPEERAVILRHALDMIGERLHPLMGRWEAATAFNVVASDICSTINFRALSSAHQAGDRLFNKPTAANDGGFE